MKRIVGLVNNRVFQVALSLAALIYFYSTTDVTKILTRISGVPLGFLVFLTIYGITVSSLASLRWGIILLGRPTIQQLWFLFKAGQSGSFFSMFLPTPLAGDGMKWIRVSSAFPSITKTHLLASVLVDRVIGMSTLVITGFIAVVLSVVWRYPVPALVIYITLGMFLGVFIFYTLLVLFNFDKFEGRVGLLDKLIQIDKAFRHERGKDILLAVAVSVVAQFIWMMPILFTSRMFEVNLTMLDVLVYVPIMSLVLALPISFAGFGPREALYVFFFSSLCHSPESLLAMSAYMGVAGLVGGLVSGIFVLL